MKQAKSFLFVFILSLTCCANDVQASAPVAPAQQYRLISREMVAILKQQLSAAPFESDQKVVLKNFVELTLKPTGLAVDGTQIVSIMSAFSFDDGKVDTLRAFQPYIVNVLPSYGAIINSLTFDSAKAEAQKILLGH